MTATVTYTFKSSLLQSLKSNVMSGSDKYYIAIGRSDVWNSTDTPPVTADSDISSLDFIQKSRHPLIAYKKVFSSALVIPRIDWTSGTIYDAYTDLNSNINLTTNPYYVMNDNLRVYVCLEQAKNSLGQGVVSTVKPTGVSLKPFTTSDGYVWQYLYQVGPEDANSFMTSNFIPVQHLRDSAEAVSAVEVEQYSLQQASVPGNVLGIEMVSGGSGYSGTVTVNITGGGSGAQGTAILSGGSVVSVKMDSDTLGNVLNGSGYKNSSVEIVGNGTGAKAIAVLGPSSGITADPTVSLRSETVMFHSDFIDTEGGAILSTNDFRQVLLVKNPTQYGNSSPFTAQVGNALKRLNFSTVPVAFLSDKEIIGTTSQAKAYLVHYDTAAWIYQNETTGFEEFSPGENVEAVEGSGSGQGTLASSNTVTAPDVDIYSGDVLYINNITSVTRDPNQTEDVKVVIKL